MRLLNEHHSFTGMQRDMSISKQPTSFLYDAKNIRLTPRGDDTMYAVTNEKGTLSTGLTITGTYLGHCLLNQYLVVFSTTSTGDEPDYITRINLEDNSLTVLYNGNLNFSVDYPIEAISSYENEDIQKVYWTDNRNQPRVINIVKKNADYRDTSFDFIPELKLQESVTVTKLFGQGQFPPGVIQYAFTYFNKYGQESNIFYTTPLYGVSYKDRGGSPEDKIANAFKIEVTNVDSNFEYLRVYSILRTSLNATPIAKRVRDIPIPLGIRSTDKLAFTDDGTIGEDIDPTELLYKGGETIRAKTMEQKDGTLFLGNISLDREAAPSIISTFIDENFSPRSVDVSQETDGERAVLRTVVRRTRGNLISTGDISYINSIDISGFKNREVYRFGIQFQHKTGKWSEPSWLRDYKVQGTPIQEVPTVYNSTGMVHISEVEVQLNDSTLLDTLREKGYKRARLLMAQPSYSDRIILCQGIANPVLYSLAKRYSMSANSSHPDRNKEGILYGQSSWIFRPKWNGTNVDTTADDGGGYIPSESATPIADTSNMYGVSAPDGKYASPTLRSTEVGAYLGYDSFKIDQEMVTIHSPELIFDDILHSQDWEGMTVNLVGEVVFDATLGDIDIQTSSPTIGSASGFVHKAVRTVGNAALVSGLFYEDYLVDDSLIDDNMSTLFYERYGRMHFPVSWPVYLWHRSGSLNNDVARSGRSAELLRKKISNYHVSNSTIYQTPSEQTTLDIKLFSSDELSIVKVDGHTYMGNIDTAVTPDKPEAKYFVGDPWRQTKDTDFLSNCYFKLALQTPGDTTTKNGVWRLSFEEGLLGIKWTNYGGTDDDIGDYVPALCESSESIRIKYKSTPHLVALLDSSSSLFASTRSAALPLVEVTRAYNKDTFYGGQSDDALKANLWLPISDPVDLSGSSVSLTSNRGDTYYQRFECLKTYAYTPEDPNQVVDIASFMVETHINIDGRYDRNRGQSSNLNMSPRNFNLFNPVYSQPDNFFNYRILDDDYYTLNKFPNQITWTKEKQAGADTDLWTNITLASTYDMDGSKGEIISLNTWRADIYCFQNKGISNILFNSRVQIPTSDGVPIEISNSYKVDGYRNISDGVGCKDRFLIKETPSGIYFIDSISGHLYHISSGIQDITTTRNMTSWFKNTGSTINKVVHDNVNNDVYLISNTDALCFSEVLGQFVSFLDYGGVSLVESYDGRVFTMKNGILYEMFQGPHNYFFTEMKPWEFTFISNGIDNSVQDFDKIFTNIDYRMDISEDGEHRPDRTLDYIQVFNEYQDTGKVSLKRLKIPDNSKSCHYKGTNLQKKFRIWRIQIPRNKNSLDRIRNTWCKITLSSGGMNNHKAVLHDLNVQYYI